MRKDTGRSELNLPKTVVEQVADEKLNAQRRGAAEKYRAEKRAGEPIYLGQIKDGKRTIMIYMDPLNKNSIEINGMVIGNPKDAEEGKRMVMKWANDNRKSFKMAQKY